MWGHWGTGVLPDSVFNEVWVSVLQTVLPELLHGEAVNIDMAFMLFVARERGLLTPEELQRIVRCMKLLELPVWHQQCSLQLIQKSLQERIKHSGGRVRMPLPTGLGRAGHQKHTRTLRID